MIFSPISTLYKCQNNIHDDDILDHNDHIELASVQMYHSKYVHIFLWDNHSEDEHHHISNKTIFIIE